MFPVALAFLAGCSSRGSPETLWLGHVAPMTGAEKPSGDRARQGIRIAVEEVNADAGNLVLGRNLAVLHADAKSAEAEIVRLASVNKVTALLGGTDTATAEQLARGAEAAGVPVVLQAALPSASSSENVYSCAPPLSRRGTVLGKFAVEKKWGKIALVAAERDSAVGPVAEAFIRELPKDATQRFTLKKRDEKKSEEKKTDDLPQLAASVAATKPQAVLFAGSTRDLLWFRAELQKALPGVILIFGGEESSLPALLADHAAVEGVYLATCYLASDETPANQAFVKQYQDQFHEPPDVNAALAYDGIRILSEALRKAGSLNAGKLREALGHLESVDSVTGPLEFGKDRHARRPLFVVQIKDGKAELQKRYGPDE